MGPSNRGTSTSVVSGLLDTKVGLPRPYQRILPRFTYEQVAIGEAQQILNSQVSPFTRLSDSL
jgi:hypothetical protein